MDGTHFVHHPRTTSIQSRMTDQIGTPWSVDSAFQFSLPDRSNIRYDPNLEPMGAIGDAGWYNMRAAVEYLSPDVVLDTVSSHLRRDPETGAAISGTSIWPAPVPTLTIPDIIPRRFINQRATVDRVMTSWVLKPMPTMMPYKK